MAGVAVEKRDGVVDTDVTMAARFLRKYSMMG
jgi:hypothetical protein